MNIVERVLHPLMKSLEARLASLEDQAQGLQSQIVQLHTLQQEYTALQLREQELQARLSERTDAVDSPVETHLTSTRNQLDSIMSDKGVLPSDTMRTLESRYYSYLYQQGHTDQEQNRQYLATYLKYVKPDTDVLDLGCGPGDFLKLTQEKGCRCIGVDMDTGMINTARQRGLNIIEANAIKYVVKQATEATFDFVLASNFIEHLSSNVVVDLVRGCFRVLRPGGRLLLATPNPESLHVHTQEFWRDLTHVRLYNRSTIEFLLFDAGFVAIESGTNAETTAMPLLHTVDMDDLQHSIALLSDTLMNLDRTTTEPQEISHALVNLTEQVRQLQNVFFYLFPPREYYVTGIKQT